MDKKKQENLCWSIDKGCEDGVKESTWLRGRVWKRETKLMKESIDGRQRENIGVTPSRVCVSVYACIEVCVCVCVCVCAGV